ncbi:MAG: choice-of-anchor tandem repeat GloVer-containing protein, partial [Ginsengibacter sp.]
MKKIIITVVFLYLVVIESNAQAQLYGLTYAGGDNDLGTIFHYNTSSASHTLDQSLNTLNGSHPIGSLTLYNGRFYGFTSDGVNGGFNGGFIFEWNPVTNIYTKKINLDETTGYRPIGKMVQSGDKLYGTTTQGAANDYGAIFEWDPATNTFSKKFDFSGGWTHGGSHSLTLFKGKFYGLSEVESYTGNIFEWDPVTNNYTIKKIFSVTDGAGPSSALVLKGDKFYGTTSGGGANYNGVAFEWDPATNVYIKKIDFDGINGGAPVGSLSLFADKFYGMTNSGGSNNAGVIFEWDPITNNYTKKFDFDRVNDALAFLFGSLTLSDNKFYGTKAIGGKYDKGLIFQWDPLANIYTKTFDFTGANGSYPIGDLVEFTNSILPIKLQSFTAEQHLHTSLLHWQTTNEVNTSHFMVQHSFNGTTFTNIGRVEARNASGNNDYSLTDASHVNGVNFYRLQMVDIDGKITYSPIIKIVFAGKNELQVFPNPAKNSITLSGLQNKGIIKIMAADGKVVKQLSAKAGSMLVDISTLAKGLYLL